MKDNIYTKIPKGNITVPLTEKLMLIEILKKRKPSLPFNTDKDLYIGLCEEINQKVKFFYHESIRNQLGEVGVTFLRDFCSFDISEKQFRKMNVDYIYLYLFSKIRDEHIIAQDVCYYVVTIFHSGERSFKQGLLTKKRDKSVTLTYDLKEIENPLRVGKWEDSGANAFIWLEKNYEQNQLKELIVLFTGTQYTDSQFLAGTFCSAKKDGTPLSGKIIFEAKKTKQEAIKHIVDNVLIPEICQWLFDTNIIAKNCVISDLSKLRQLNAIDIKEYVGDYKLFWAGRLNGVYEKIYVNEITIFPDGSFHNYNPFSKKKHIGRVYLKDVKNLELISYDYDENGQITGVGNLLLLNVNTYGKLQVFIPGVGLSFDGELNPSAFAVVLTANLNLTIKDPVIEGIFNDYLNKYSNSRFPAMTIYEVEEIRKRLK